MRILVLEDDEQLGAYLDEGLSSAGHQVDVVGDGRHALTAATSSNHDVVVLDRMTPGLDGLAVLKAIRAAGLRVPVLMLTVMNQVEDRVEGLDAGADDYLAKPFAFSELLARLNALARRGEADGSGEPTTLRAQDLELDLVRRRCTRAGQLIELTSMEFRLLETLLRGRGRVQTKTMLLEKVWGLGFVPTTSVVETHVSRLRSRIDKPFDEQLLRTIRGAGYVIDADA
ncbi:MAG: response regulator transcription factor [Acidobacteriota bacterium]